MVCTMNNQMKTKIENYDCNWLDTQDSKREKREVLLTKDGTAAENSVNLLACVVDPFLLCHCAT